MPTYTLRGVDIEFPYEAYDCQIAYMKQVVKALQDGTNALLESPTGTGKTLCLLCATLAWRKWNRKRGSGGAGSGVGGSETTATTRNAPPSSSSSQPPTWAQAMRDAVAAAQAAESATPGHRGAPPIVYASRTHSQLAQAMNELKRTSYAAETTAVALGSRAQLCCNPSVASLGSGAAANQACSAAVKSGSCGWHSRVDSFLRDNPGAASVGLGLEELHKLAGDGRAGSGSGPCPFYVSRGLAPTADVVFVPYNYLVDPRSRAGLRQLAWRGAVVVFDEAHNLEGAAADAASFDLTAPALAAAIDEAGAAANAAQRRSESEGGATGGNGGGGSGGDRRGQRPAAAPTSTMGSSSADAGTGPPDYGSMARDLRLLAGVLRGLESAIARAAEGLLPAESKGGSGSSFGNGNGGGGGSGAAAGKTFPAQFLFDLLGSVGITPSSMLPLTRLMDDASDVLAEEAARNGSRATGGGAALAALADCLRLAFESSEPPTISGSSAAGQAGRPGASATARSSAVASPAAAESYRVHLWRSAPANNNNASASAPPQQSSNNNRWRNSSSSTPAAAPPPPPSSTTSTPTLSYWCFSAGVALRAVASAGARSLLLTSGTLSPLPALAAELSPLRFPVTLENPHVVPDANVWASVVSTGPLGTRLNSSFRTRESSEYKSDLGCLVASVAASSPGGLLVFFPSYAALGSAVSHWKTAKAPPRLAPPYAAHAATIWDAICWAKGRVFVEPRGSAGGSTAFASAVLEYRAALAAPGSRGAAFLAVCRGKASEGLDFSDDAARAVVVTGLPYALATDARVSIKRTVLDESARKILAANGNQNSNKRALNNNGGGGGGSFGNSSSPPSNLPAPPPLAPLTGEAWYVQQAARAVNQAVGRVIRHVGDYGAIVLADERFAFGGGGNGSGSGKGGNNSGGGFGPRSQLSAWVRRLLATPSDFDQAMSSLLAFFRARGSASGGGAAAGGGRVAATAATGPAARVASVGTLRPAFAPPPSSQNNAAASTGGARVARRGVNTAGLVGLLGSGKGGGGGGGGETSRGVAATQKAAAAAAAARASSSSSFSPAPIPTRQDDDGVVERLLAGLESGSAFGGGAARTPPSSSAAAAAAAAPPVAPVFARAASAAVAASAAAARWKRPTAIPSGLPPSRPVVESVGPRPRQAEGQAPPSSSSRPPLAAKQQQQETAAAAAAAAAVPAAHPPAPLAAKERSSQQQPSEAAPPQTQQSQQQQQQHSQQQQPRPSSSSSSPAEAQAPPPPSSSPKEPNNGSNNGNNGGSNNNSVHSYLAALKAGLPPEEHARVTAALRAYRPGGGEGTAGDAARLILEVAAVLGASASASSDADTLASRLPLLKGFGRFVPQAHRAAFERVVAEAEAAARAAATAAARAEGKDQGQGQGQGQVQVQGQQQQQQKKRPSASASLPPPPPPPPSSSSNPFFSASASAGAAGPKKKFLPSSSSSSALNRPHPSQLLQLPRTGPGGRALPAQRPSQPASIAARGGVAGPGGSLLPQQQARGVGGAGGVGGRSGAAAAANSLPFSAANPGGALGGGGGPGFSFYYDQRRPGEIGGRRAMLQGGGVGQQLRRPQLQQLQQQQRPLANAAALPSSSSSSQQQQQQQQSSGSARALAAVAAAKQRQDLLQLQRRRNL